jgi:hypothetical protein
LDAIVGLTPHGVIAMNPLPRCWNDPVALSRKELPQIAPVRADDGAYCVVRPPSTTCTARIRPNDIRAAQDDGDEGRHEPLAGAEAGVTPRTDQA